MVINIRDLNLAIPNKNTVLKTSHIQILKDFNVDIPNVPLTVIIGPSGCGKSTFLNTLCGNVPNGSLSSGTILVDGKERENTFIENIGFLEQENFINDELTIYEKLEYVAILRGFDRKEMLTEINHIVDILDITDVLHTKIQHISAGQRKRLSIAIELILRRDIIVLDEPTSLLDNMRAYSLVKYLYSLNKQVIISINIITEELIEFFSYCILICNSEIVCSGTIAEVIKILEEKGYERKITGLFFSEALVKYKSERPIDILTECTTLKNNLIIEKYTLQWKKIRYLSKRYFFNHFDLRKKYQFGFKILILLLILSQTYNFFNFCSLFEKGNIIVTSGNFHDYKMAVKNIYLNSELRCMRLFNVYNFALAPLFLFSIYKIFSMRNITKREIERGYYNSTTYYFSILISEGLFYSGIILLNLIFYLFFSNIVNVIPVLFILLLYVCITTMLISLTAIMSKSMTFLSIFAFVTILLNYSSYNFIIGFGGLFELFQRIFYILLPNNILFKTVYTFFSLFAPLILTEFTQIILYYFKGTVKETYYLFFIKHIKETVKDKKIYDEIVAAKVSSYDMLLNFFIRKKEDPYLVVQSANFIIQPYNNVVFHYFSKNIFTTTILLLISMVLLFISGVVYYNRYFMSDLRYKL